MQKNSVFNFLNDARSGLSEMKAVRPVDADPNIASRYSAPTDNVSRGVDAINTNKKRQSVFDPEHDLEMQK